MEKSLLIYAIFILFFGVLTISVIAVPFLAFSRDMGYAYEIFGPTCHQKLSRSLCLFNSEAGYWISDCTKQDGTYTTIRNDREQIKVEIDGAIGYKMPVCSRDFGLYGAMFLAALVYPLIRDIGNRSIYPPAYLIIALIPIGLDGGIQFVSEFGLLPFLYESSNAIRLITGTIAGAAASFYAIPIMMNILIKGIPGKDKKKSEVGKA